MHLTKLLLLLAPSSALLHGVDFGLVQDRLGQARVDLQQRRAGSEEQQEWFEVEMHFYERSQRFSCDAGYVKRAG